MYQVWNQMYPHFHRLKVRLRRNCLQFLIEMNPLRTSVPHHIETSQLICNANQLPFFCMMGNIDR